MFKGLTSPGEIKKELATREKLRRKELKISQKEMAKRAGVSLGSLRRFEQSGEISLSSLVNIAFALNCEEDFEALFKRKNYSSVDEAIAQRKLAERNRGV